MGPLTRIETVARILSNIAGIAAYSQELARRYTLALSLAQINGTANDLYILSIDTFACLRDLKG